ncbi:centrobin [Dendropsophus ebraccatus]|uniref:centrobin n=1 Tax=Dendropsophus ebraccatus TaxID=150705 RepID=UPI0038320F18
MALPHAFSLQDASLLSGIEPLPLSSPASPHHSLIDLSSSPPLLSSPSTSLRRAVSSEVTAQLYASLRRSQEADEEEEPQEIHRGSGRTEPAQGSTMASEVEDLAEELSRRLQEGVEASGRKEPSPYITQMESLRCHLKNMLTLSSTVTSYGEAPGKRLEQQSDTTSTLLSAHPGQDISPPLSLVGLEGLFPRYSTLYNAPLPDLQLREALEKEMARRKHLERHVQNLQNEMLELQQRVSVMLAADRRKDSMIQQLDQTLALVVGGWKQQEQQREESLRLFRQEKEAAEQARSRDQETLTQVERQLSEALESLDREKTATKERKIELQRLVDEQTTRVSQLKEELEAEEEARKQERRELDTLRHRMQEQQRSWEEREQELQEECRRVQDEGRRELEKEKAMSQQEMQKSQQLQLALAALQGDIMRLECDLQTSHRERDTLQMELNLEKARNESEKVRVESEHKMRLEEVITERLGALQEESAQHLCSVREQHRKQLLELTSQHEAELCRQMSQFKSELQERERRHRDIAMDYEQKLSHSEERYQELSRSLRRLESERAEMLSQLQDVMKSHWSQALRVLTAKVPSEHSSVAIPHQQTESSEQWTSQITREGVYGEETSTDTRKGIVGADNLTGISNQRLNESQNETDTRVHSSGLQTIASGSQHLGDQESRRAGSRSLTDSRGSDLINFSRIMDERSQSLIGSSSVKEQSLRFMGDGAHMSTKAVIANKTGDNAAPSDTQLMVNFNQSDKAPGAADTTGLFSGGAFNTGDIRTIQEIMTSDSIRKYIASQNIREPYGQVMVEKSQHLFYPETTGLNILGTDKSKNTSGHFVTRNENHITRDGSSHQILGIQSSMGSSQQMPFLENSILSHAGTGHFKNSGASSFTNAPSQSLNLRNSNTVQIHNHYKDDANWTTAGASSQIKESSISVIHPSLDRAPLTVPNLSPISKFSIQGHSHEYSIPSAYRENPVSGRQPSHRVPEPEESFYPMQVEELSQSFSSHHGFFPLEPHPDGTMTGTEHPLHEESSISIKEAPSIWAGQDQATSNPVLQHYIRMLLDRTPGDPLNVPDKGLFHENPDVIALSQSLQSRGDHPLPRSNNKEQGVSKFPTSPKKNPAKGPEAVKKEVLSNQRRPGPPKPLKRVSARGGRTGIWK